MEQPCYLKNSLSQRTQVMKPDPNCSEYEKDIVPYPLVLLEFSCGRPPECHQSSAQVTISPHGDVRVRGKGAVPIPGGVMKLVAGTCSGSVACRYVWIIGSLIARPERIPFHCLVLRRAWTHFQGPAGFLPLTLPVGIIRCQWLSRTVPRLPFAPPLVFSNLTECRLASATLRAPSSG